MFIAVEKEERVFYRCRQSEKSWYHLMLFFATLNVLSQSCPFVKEYLFIAVEKEERVFYRCRQNEKSWYHLMLFFAKIREIKFPQKFSKSGVREIKFPRNFPESGIREIKNYKCEYRDTLTLFC